MRLGFGNSAQRAETNLKEAQAEAERAELVFKTCDAAAQYYSSEEWRRVCNTVLAPEIRRLEHAHASTDLRDADGNPNLEVLSVIKGQRNECLLLMSLEQRSAADLEKATHDRNAAIEALQRATAQYRRQAGDDRKVA